MGGEERKREEGGKSGRERGRERGNDGRGGGRKVKRGREEGRRGRERDGEGGRGKEIKNSEIFPLRRSSSRHAGRMIETPPSFLYIIIEPTSSPQSRRAPRSRLPAHLYREGEFRENEKSAREKKRGE